MDRLRGSFDPFDRGPGGAPDEEDFGVEAEPVMIGHNERRMQVRAYNYWASLLQHRNYPAPGDLDPTLPEFASFGILLDFSQDRSDPDVAHLGRALADECGVAHAGLQRLSDVPHSSLLSQITDHCRQTIANEAPVGFAAEFVNQRGALILYRGILLPFSADDDTIDSIYGVINWKELVDPETASELHREFDRALSHNGAVAGHGGPLTDWADGPFSAPATAEPAVDQAPADQLTAQLRSMAGCALADLSGSGAEFGLVLIRRGADGSVSLLGEVPDDAALVERAARRLID